MSYVAWASDIDEDPLEQVGGKGANLAEMMGVGLPVPTAFFVTSRAFASFLEEAGIEEKIASLVEDLDVDDQGALEEASERIHEVITEREVPQRIRSDIVDAYERLEDDGPASVAIRSSATAEDLPEASFAGQQETFLHVLGPEDVVDRVQACWASLYTPRAIYYRVKNDFPHEQVRMGVVVQRMVEAEEAGVLFTRHPTTGNDRIIVEAAWGLGEGVVSGRVSPDNYVLSREGAPQEVTVARKETEIVRDGEEGTVEREVDEDRREQRVLEDDQLERLAGLARTLEDHYGEPQDVEWAYEDGELFVLQTRPVTTIKEPETMTETADESEEAELLIEGLGASPGKGAGPVVRLDGADELDRCEEGDVLVTTMTTPDMVPAMRRASAIVTDEGGMTCFPGETQVLTDQGLLTMEQIRERIGNEELKALSIDPQTLEPAWKPILTSMRRRAPVIEVSVSQTRASSANTLRLTPDHKMMVLDGTELVERPMEDVLDRGDMVTVADDVPALAAPGRWPVPPYLAGALFTDGHWRIDDARGAVEFIQKDTEAKRAFIDEVKAGLEGPLAASVAERTVAGTSTIRGHTFESESLRLYAQQRRPANLVQRTYASLDVLALQASEDELVAFLAGAADGDGTFEAGGNRLQIYSGDRQLTEGIVLACLRLGIQPTVSPNRESCENIQIREGLGPILERSQRFDPDEAGREAQTAFLPARQVLDETVDQVNPGGRIKPYVERNLLLGADKLEGALATVDDDTLREDLGRLVDAPIRAKRVRREASLAEQDVYNLTVEGNHNYVVFTDQLTPVLVANCHAAIVGRELGVPCVVGAKTATQDLDAGREVTVDGDRGTVTAGIQTTETSTETDTQPAAGGVSRVPTATEVKVNISMPEATERARGTDADGVGLLRVEHIVLGLGRHPMNVIEEDGTEEFAAYLEEGIRTVAEAFDPRPVWVRTLDAPTDEFRQLPGGEREPHEANPMLGWRGIRRDLDQPELLEAQFDAIRRLREDGFHGVGVMLPLVQHPEELREAKRVARQAGLDPEDPDFQFGIMIETPASALVVDQLVDEGLDFVSFGTNDLTQYTLAVDRNNGNVAPLFDEFHPGVGRLIQHVIEVCNERDVETSICGQAGSDPDFAANLVEWGISSISANIDAVDSVRQTVAREEQRLILEDVRERR